MLYPFILRVRKNIELLQPLLTYNGRFLLAFASCFMQNAILHRKSRVKSFNSTSQRCRINQHKHYDLSPLIINPSFFILKNFLYASKITFMPLYLLSHAALSLLF